MNRSTYADLIMGMRSRVHRDEDSGTVTESDLYSHIDYRKMRGMLKEMISHEMEEERYRSFK